VTGSCYATVPNVSNKKDYLRASLGTAISIVPKENDMKIYSVKISAKGYICRSVEWIYLEAELEVEIIKYSSVNVQSNFPGVNMYIYIYIYMYT
jgi:hypothetical protein